jgi:hypothetical protein
MPSQCLYRPGLSLNEPAGSKSPDLIAIFNPIGYDEGLETRLETIPSTGAGIVSRRFRFPTYYPLSSGKGFSVPVKV